MVGQGGGGGNAPTRNHVGAFVMFPGFRTVEVLQGVLPTVQGEAYVVNVNEDVTQGGRVLASLMEAERSVAAITQELASTLPGNRSPPLGVYSRPLAPNNRLGVRHMIFAVAPPFNADDPASAIQRLSDVVLRCLEELSRLQVSSAVFPVLSYNYRGFPFDSAFLAIMETINQFMRTNPQSSLRNISVIAPQPQNAQTMVDLLGERAGGWGLTFVGGLRPSQYTQQLRLAQQNLAHGLHTLSAVEVVTLLAHRGVNIAPHSKADGSSIWEASYSRLGTDLGISPSEAAYLLLQAYLLHNHAQLTDAQRQACPEAQRGFPDTDLGFLGYNGQQVDDWLKQNNWDTRQPQIYNIVRGARGALLASLSVDFLNLQNVTNASNAFVQEVRAAVVSTLPAQVHQTLPNLAHWTASSPIRTLMRTTTGQQNNQKSSQTAAPQPAAFNAPPAFNPLAFTASSAPPPAYSPLPPQFNPAPASTTPPPPSFTPPAFNPTSTAAPPSFPTYTPSSSVPTPTPFPSSNAAPASTPFSSSNAVPSSTPAGQPTQPSADTTAAPKKPFAGVSVMPAGTVPLKPVKKEPQSAQVPAQQPLKSVKPEPVSDDVSNSSDSMDHGSSNNYGSAPGSHVAAPSFPSAAPSFPSAAPSFPSAAPSFPSAAPSFPGAAPSFPGAAPSFAAPSFAAPNFAAPSFAAPNFAAPSFPGASSFPGSNAFAPPSFPTGGDPFSNSFGGYMGNPAGHQPGFVPLNTSFYNSGDGDMSIPPHIRERIKCKYTKKTMTDPVIAADGHTYERAAIVDYLQSFNVSPVTGHELSSKDLVVDVEVLELIKKHCK